MSDYEVFNGPVENWTDNCKISLKELGRLCAEARRLHGFTQQDVQNDLECGVKTISAFEHGRNDSAAIFQWYLNNVNIKKNNIMYTSKHIRRCVNG